MFFILAVKQPVRYLLLLVAFAAVTTARGQKSQTVTGTLSGHASQAVSLYGFNMLKDTLLGSAITDSKGHFVMQYPHEYTGAGLLRVKDGPSFILLLNREDLQLRWENLQDPKGLVFENSKENKAFDEGMTLYAGVGARLSGLYYLLSLYEKDKPFYKTAEKEVGLQKGLFSDFMKTLPESSYVSYYLNLRGLLQEINTVANNPYFPTRGIEESFLKLDFADPRLVHSGLYGPLLESYFTMLGNAAAGEDRIGAMTRAVDRVITTLDFQCTARDDIGAFLFNGLEQKGFQEAARHLANRMLSSPGCPIDVSMRERYQQYSILDIGKTAPDIVFDYPVKGKKRLSDITAKYKLLVFGSSECPECQAVIPELQQFYSIHKDLDIAVLWISTDLSKSAFDAFRSDFSFYSYCDLKGWDSPAVKDFHVFATPTLYLLNASNTIILKPSDSKEVLRFFERNR